MAQEFWSNLPLVDLFPVVQNNNKIQVCHQRPLSASRWQLKLPLPTSYGTPSKKSFINQASPNSESPDPFSTKCVCYNIRTSSTPPQTTLSLLNLRVRSIFFTRSFAFESLYLYDTWYIASLCCEIISINSIVTHPENWYDTQDMCVPIRCVLQFYIQVDYFIKNESAL